MARVVIYLLEPEMNALNQLAQQEYRPEKSQAVLIIRNELKRLGLIEGQLAGGDKQPELSAETEAGGCNMLEQPSQAIELTAEQRRNLGHVYRMIPGWRRDRKNKTGSPLISESMSGEHPSPQTKSDSHVHAESES